MTSIAKDGNLLKFHGSNFLKQRLILSILSGKPIQIVDIRSDDDEPGLRGYEVSLIRLFDKISNGSEIDINKSGTAVYFKPGLLHGGIITHDCNVERGIGYYLDILLALGPFCKLPVNATLRGVTNSKDCPSVDHIKSSALPNLIKFLVVDDGLELKVKQRGLRPLGGGEVTFKCPVRKVLRSLQFCKPGMIKRIRGIAYASKVSPALANRAIESAKGKLLQFIPDIYIYADQNRGKNAGNSPGFGINLVAETTDGVFYAAEHVSNDVSKGESVTIPEDLGTIAAYKLLEEVYRGGCVDSTFQWLTVLYMALGQKNISKFITGPLSDYTIHFLQHLYEFFAITFKLDNPKVEDYGGLDEEDTLPGANKVLLTCVGIGYTNMNKRTN